MDGTDTIPGSAQWLAEAAANRERLASTPETDGRRLRARRYYCNDAARTLAADNRGLAFDQARRSYRIVDGRVPLDELEGEALLALARAASVFEPERGLQFSTLATTAIRRGLITFCARWLQRQFPAGTSSLDALAGGDQEWAWDFLTSRLPDPAVGAERSDGLALLAWLRQKAEAAVGPRDVAMAWAHVGLGMQLHEVGRRYGVSRERVRQCARRVLAVMRRAAEAKGATR